MASLVRSSLRVVKGVRNMSTHHPILAERAASSAKHAQQWGTYKTATLFLALPACVAVGYKAFYVAEHPHPEEFVPYSHLRTRKKSYPWGDGNHTLFHTDDANVLPEGWTDGFGPGHEHH